MTVRSRLVLTILGISVLMAAPALYAVSRLSRMRELSTTQVDKHAAARVSVGKLNTAMAEIERWARGYIINGTADQRANMLATLDVARSEFQTLRRLRYRPAARNAEAQFVEIE